MPTWHVIQPARRALHLGGRVVVAPRAEEGGVGLGLGGRARELGDRAHRAEDGQLGVAAPGWLLELTLREAAAAEEALAPAGHRVRGHRLVRVTHTAGEPVGGWAITL